jgi:hypothetical protein
MAELCIIVLAGTLLDEHESFQLFVSRLFDLEKGTAQECKLELRP